MGKDTKKQLMKAEQLLKAMQYKKAAKIFKTLGEIYLNQSIYEKAKDCFFNAAKCLMNEEKYFVGLDSLRNAGNAALFLNDFEGAHEFFRDALEYVPSIRNKAERNNNFVLYSSLSYLCLFIKGKHEEGIKLIKKIRSHVDDSFFKESPLIKLIKDITLAIKDKNSKYLEKIEKEFNQYKFREGEINLAKQSLVIVKTHIALKTNLKLDKDVYTTNDLIKLILEIDSVGLKDISKNSFYNYELKQFKIFKIGLTISDNFTSQKKPELPVIINSGQIYQLEFHIKPHFQMENSLIGPIKLSSEIDGNLIFFYDNHDVLKPQLISPLPTLDISIKNLRPPLIGQTFPLEILIENKSEGEALDLNLELYFPEEIKVMRGTLKKQIYSLKTNENMKWEISLKPLEAGDYIIKVEIKFKDPDQNVIEDTKDFPFSIKL